MTTSPARLFAETLADATSSSSERFADLAVSVRVADVETVARGRKRWRAGTDDELLFVGGRWDRRLKRWTEETARSFAVIRFTRGQEDAARWFCDWLRRWLENDWEGFKRPNVALFVGGRRAGKTNGACAASVLIGVAEPKAIVWMVSPSVERSDELDVEIRKLMPRAWYRRTTSASDNAIDFTLRNGSRIRLRSGAKNGKALKAGKATFVVLNEAQEQNEKGFANARGAVVDVGSLVLLCANPPDQPSGEYVTRLWDGVEAGTIDGAAFHFNPERNPWIEMSSLEAMRSEVDEMTYRRDVLGEIGTPVQGTVLHAWSRANIREPGPELVDITAEVTRRELGHAAAYCMGVDLQRMPACVASVVKVFRDPAQPDEEIAFVVDEFDGKDEDDLLNEIESTERWQVGGRVTGQTYRGWKEPTDGDPVHVAAVLDASSKWQDSAHQSNSSSDKLFIARRWRALFPPDKESSRNPDLLQRFRVANGRLRSAAGVRRLFVHPRCVATIEALKSYPLKNGVPDRRHKYAHRVDAVTYVTFRLWGRVRIERTGKIEYRSVGRFDRADSLRGDGLGDARSFLGGRSW